MAAFRNVVAGSFSPHQLKPRWDALKRNNERRFEQVSQEKLQQLDVKIKSYAEGTVLQNGMFDVVLQSK